MAITDVWQDVWADVWQDVWGPPAEPSFGEVWWPVVLRRLRKRREYELKREELRKAKRLAKQKIRLRIKQGGTVTESALLKLAEAGVRQAVPDIPADDMAELALDILIEVAAGIARMAEDEDEALLLLA